MHKRLAAIYGFTEDTIYLSPAPLHHSAPIGYSTEVQACGGTVAVMEKFDPVEVLRAIDTYWVTHSQWVPTMFVRMLKLPEADRSAFHLHTQSGDSCRCALSNRCETSHDRMVGSHPC